MVRRDNNQFVLHRVGSQPHLKKNGNLRVRMREEGSACRFPGVPPSILPVGGLRRWRI